ncbi:MAG TPA: CHRD domain-containing protein [Euzebya sp.]|nr:CHRD domain-containing protein [Euzebya sp.]
MNHTLIRRIVLVIALTMGLMPLALAPAGAAEFDVEVDDFLFAPDELFVNVGDTVNWNWVGIAEHNVTPLEEGAFDPSPTQTEGTHPVTFEEPGEVPYYCSIHSSPDGTEGMIGTVNVLAEGEPLPEPLPEPRPAPEPGRLPATTEAVGTSLAWSSLFADGSAPTVLLGRDDVFADSLASGMVQGLEDAPLLLTPTDTLDARVEAELERLATEHVVILGGVSAISPAVEARLIELGLTVERVEGQTRIETAIDIAQTFQPDATEAFLVRSDAAPGAGDPTQAFADSLTVGGLAARELLPVLLSQTDRLSDTTRAYLEQSAIETVYIVGGVAALSEQVQVDLEALGIEPARVAGANRFATMSELLFTFLQGPPEVALLVDGQAPNAWVSGFTAASAAESSMIVLSNGPDLPLETMNLLLVVLPAPSGVPVLCGPTTDATACDRAEIAGQTTSLPSPDVRFAQLQGSHEIPGPGHETALGDFTLLPTPADDALCYEVVTYQIGEPVTGAHIHTGVVGEAGDIVVPLTTLGDRLFVRDCAFDLDPALIDAIVADPASYYVNLHTATHPAGAVRGQLFRPEFMGIAELQPDAEVPPTEAQGGGFSLFLADADDETRVCYFMGFFIEGEDAIASHIHEAPEGENGDVVVTLPLPPPDVEFGGAAGPLCVDVDPALRNDLLANPGDYYVNVHTEAHPGGAIRGQLLNPFAGDGPPPAAFAGYRH